MLVSHRPHALTPTEKRIVTLLAMTGWSTTELAIGLGMAHSTLRTHMSHIEAKLQVHSMAGIVVWAYQSHFVGVRKLGV